jgi:hypothetical protein
MTRPQCEDCCSDLTDEEFHYYGKRCEQCERRAFKRREAWRIGAPDPELDAFYSAPRKPTTES